MVISGMNRYFAKHGRWVFAIIAVVISVAFVASFSRISVMDIIMDRGKSNTESLLGRKVTIDDRRVELDKTLILAAMRNPAFDIKRARMPISSQQLGTQLMLSYAADDMGIAVSDAAVSKFIKKTSAFQTDGKFDMKKYGAFVKDKLKPAKLTKTDMDAAVRGQLKIEYLQKCILDNVIIPEDEIKEAYKNLNGKVEAKRIKFQAAKFADKIKYTGKEIRDYFEAHKVEYRTAPASKGAVVLFDYADFNDAAAKSVTIADIEKYYNDHKFLYVKKNLKKTVLKKDAKIEYEPLAKVSAKIRIIQAETKAKELAFAAAQKFSDKLYNRMVDVFYDEQDKIAATAKCAKIFADSAGDAKRKIQSTGWLVEGVATGAGLQTESSLVSTLNKLPIDNPLSEPIKGSHSVYVALLKEKRSTKLETFEQAEKRVKAAYLKEKSLSLARETARNTALKISEKLDKSVTIADIEKKLNLKFEDFQITPYSMVSPAESDAAFSTPVGKLARMVETPSGAVLLYVAAKPVPTMKEYEKQKKFFAMRYKMMKRNAIFRNYMESLVSVSASAKKEK